MLWEPFLLALGLGLVISIGLYAAYRWPPDDASAPPPDADASAPPPDADGPAEPPP